MNLNTNLPESMPGKSEWVANMDKNQQINKFKNNVDHPPHYGGEDDPYEAIKVIEAWDLGFHLGNVLKYLSRAGKKDPSKTIEDIQKAKWYLDRYLEEYQVSQIKKIKI